MAHRKLPWQPLNSNQIADILLYVRSLPAIRGQKKSFDLAGGEDGAALFASKGCAGCHKGILSLESRLKEKTVADIAVAMWKHVPQMPPGTASRF